MDDRHRIAGSAPRILFVSSEVFPLAKTGGLADVSSALPAALSCLGADVRVMLPGYSQALDLAGCLDVVSGCELPDGRLLMGRLPDSGVPIILFDAPALFAREGGIYQDSDRKDWPDNDHRFAAFCRAAAFVALGRTTLGWRPQIVHANDWHTGMISAFLHFSGQIRPKTVFTIHNLAFQGNFPLTAFSNLGLPSEALSPEGIEFYNQISFIKAAIRYSDRLTTVSPTYAREILTPEHGCGLDGLLRARAADLTGILNGVDYDVWDPANDTELPCPYSHDDLAGKDDCKASLRHEMGLSQAVGAPLIGYVNRLTHQKMADVVLDVVPRIVANGAQIVVHGKGDRAFEERFESVARAHPDNVAVRLGYTEALAHRIVGGCDLSLTPARFEPCGLTTMYAMRYGALPVTRAVGGLVDTVEDAGTVNADDDLGSGFAFARATVDDMEDSLIRASSWYHDSDAWKRLQRRAMLRDFGWKRSAQRYLELYAALLGGAPPRFDERPPARDEYPIAPSVPCDALQMGG
ncbi:glycogen synthase GlgA [Vineibacter terrae]|uniref:Glycogen synthase n=2 Tax=Vineibacter terrae TaxID=2586908 RepID=A0A5C8PHD1_9HYPH|nr:glycogen synthase GlgA [Vineibacter terrae]